MSSRLMAIVWGLALLAGVLLPQLAMAEEKASAVPAEIVSLYDPEPAPKSLTAKELDVRLDEVKASLCFLGFWFDGRVAIEVDSFLIPNGNLARITTEWTGVFTQAGNNILRAPTEAEQAENKRFSRGACPKLFLTDTKSIPVSARGTMNLTVPVKFESVSFTAADAGQSRQSPAFSVSLETCKGDVARFQVKGISTSVDNVRLVFRDQTGQRIRPGLVSCSRLLGTLNFQVQAKGRIASLEIFVPTETVSRSIPVCATSAPVVPKPDLANDARKQEDVPVKAAAPRYLVPVAKPVYVEMDEAKTKVSIEVLAGFSSSFVNKSPRLVIILPPVANSAKAKIDFGKPELFDAQKRQVNYAAENGFSMPAPFTFEKDLNPPNGGRGALDFVRAAGKVKIRYPARIRQIILTADHPEADGAKALFAGAKVSVERAIDNPETRSSEMREFEIYGCDATGRELKMTGFASLSSNAVKETRSIMFWGEPKEVRIFVVEKWLELEIPYDLIPTPLKKEPQ